jgi:hypothetical protein
MKDESKLIARWKEGGKPRQKKCKSATEARKLEAETLDRARRARSQRMEIRTMRESIQMSQPEPRKDAVIEDQNSRSDGRSVSIGRGGVVLALGAQAASTEEAKLLKEADKAASRLENLYARTYTDVLLATGKSEGWSEEEVSRASKAASLQFKAALPRCGGGEQRDIFVTCVIAGIALNVFTAKEASQLLYGAQVMATGRKPR